MFLAAACIVFFVFYLMARIISTTVPNPSWSCGEGGVPSMDKPIPCCSIMPILGFVLVNSHKVVISAFIIYVVDYKRLLVLFCFYSPSFSRLGNAQRYNRVLPQCLISHNKRHLRKAQDFQSLFLCSPANELSN